MKYLITGGAGSLGKALVKRLTTNGQDNKVVVYSRDEGKHTIFRDNTKVKCVIGNVRDLEKLTAVFKQENPDYVIHAAALKRIDDMERNPDECWKTNVVGSENVCKAALTAGVKKCILVSTDKACMPINVYGASKFTAERTFAFYANMDTGTKFASVRYGNVIASRGSFVPMWQSMLRNKTGGIQVTHPDCARFLFTLNDAVDFILTSLTVMQGRGEVFVPHLQPYNIMDVLDALCVIEGVNRDDIYVAMVGIRPGEKMHEDMLSQPEIPLSTLLTVSYPLVDKESVKIVAIASQLVGKYTWNNRVSEFEDYTGEPMNTSIGINRNQEELVALVRRGIDEAN